MLLDRNPNADAADNKGYTPLHNAAQFAGLPEVPLSLSLSLFLSGSLSLSLSLSLSRSLACSLARSLCHSVWIAHVVSEKHCEELS